MKVIDLIKALEKVPKDMSVRIQLSHGEFEKFSYGVRTVTTATAKDKERVLILKE